MISKSPAIHSPQNTRLTLYCTQRQATYDITLREQGEQDRRDHGTLRHSSAAAWVETGGGLRLPLRPDAPILDGREVIYAVRPEHLSLVGPSDGLPTPIHVVEQTGLDMLAFGKLADTSVCCLLRGRPDVAPGQQVHLRPDLGNVHIFDAANGERLGTR